VLQHPEGWVSDQVTDQVALMKFGSYHNEHARVLKQLSSIQFSSVRNSIYVSHNLIIHCMSIKRASSSLVTLKCASKLRLQRLIDFIPRSHSYCLSPPLCLEWLNGSITPRMHSGVTKPAQCRVHDDRARPSNVLYPVYSMKLARQAGSSSQLVELARRASSSS